MGDSVLRFYDQLADSYHLVYHNWKEEGVPRHGETLDRLIQAELGSPPLTVLDCSCGIGTQAIALARRGYTVHGTDLSPRSIERARREADVFGVDIDFGVADFRSLETLVDGEFDVVLSGDNSIAHLISDEDLHLGVRNMWSKVRPGGLLLIGIRDYDELNQTRPRTTTPSLADDPEGRHATFQVWDWSESGRTYRGHLFILREVDGNWDTQHYATEFRVLLRGELTYLLGQVGFSDIRWHLPAETGHHQPIVTARKPSARAEAQAGPRVGFATRLLQGHLQRGAVYSLLAGALLVLGTLSFILQAVAARVEARPAFMGGCTAVALATLFLSLWSADRGDVGAATAWAWFALPFTVLLALIVLPLAHVATTLGLSSCDPLNTSCGSPVFGFWLALGLFAAAAVLIGAAIRLSPDAQ